MLTFIHLILTEAPQCSVLLFSLTEDETKANGGDNSPGVELAGVGIQVCLTTVVLKTELYPPKFVC